MDEILAARCWARDEFEHLTEGDPRHRRRLLDLASAVLLSPAGTITEVFPTSAQRKGAYAFLSSRVVSTEALLLACGQACALRAADFPTVLIPLDGSCLSLPDPHGRKRFGRLGSRQKGRGLKVISALAVAPDGTPLGLLAQTWWARPRAKRKKQHARLPVAKKETQRWLDTIETAHQQLANSAPDTRGVFLIDREGDGWAVLGTIDRLRRHFIIRAAKNRNVIRADGSKGKLRETLAEQEVRSTFVLDVPAGPKRLARRATMEVRTATVLLPLKESWSNTPHPQTTHVVSVREVAPPKGQTPLDWLLMSNLPIDTDEQVCLVIDGYQTRWLVESFHKTWKSGGCQVEDTQLRDRDRVSKWAAILATVALRIERIKYLGRTEPDKPASEEFSVYELNALLLLKQKEKKRTETIPNEIPTMGQATRWLAHLGGYVEQKSPPGAITLGRGLKRVRAGAEMLEALELTPLVTLEPAKKPRKARRTG